MMYELFKWGFVLAMLLTWIAMGVGVLMLLVPVDPRARQAAEHVDQRRAA